MKVVAVTTLAASWLFALAQSQYVIDPNSVPRATRDYWCMNQITQCPLICLQKESNTAQTISNECNAKTLTYSCVCSSGLSPNVSEYSQTLPFFTCQEWGTQCVSNCGSDSSCAYTCRANHPCGALNPTRVNVSTATAGAEATSTKAAPGTIYSGFGQGAAVSNKPLPTGNAAASLRTALLSSGQSLGTFVVIGALFGGFAVML